MQLSAIGPKVVNFTSNNAERDDKRHERVGDAAAATGAAAVKSTKGLKQTFGDIDKSAKEATKKLAANGRR